VDASSIDNVWAVGRVDDQPVVIRNVGATWPLVPLPPAIIGVRDLAVLAPTDVWVLADTADDAVILHWDGSAWSVVPDQAPAGGYFSRIDASTPDNVWATGTFYDGSFYRPFLEHFDGTSWTRLDYDQQVLGAVQGFTSLSTTSANDVWFTFYQSLGGPSTRGPVSVHFDGTSWTRQLIAPPGSGDAMGGIVSNGPSDAWAVGSGIDGGDMGPATYHWNGVTWTEEPPPALLPTSSVGKLHSVARASDGTIWAVGDTGLSAYAARRCDGPTGPVPDFVARVSGADRIATALAISSYRPAGSATTVVLSRSDDFADALAGTPLAVKEGGPLLLTPPGGPIDTRVLAEVQRLLPPGRTVYILGGPVALSTQVDAALNAAGYPVTRLQGINRYGTAVAIAHTGLGDPPVQFLATGLGFADALAAGTAAAVQLPGAAVLLTNGTALPPETATYLTQHPATRFALGGPAAAIAGIGATPLVGADRYATAALVAETFFPEPAGAVFASGATFPDALAGGVLAGRAGVPLLLTAPGTLPAPVDAYLTAHRAALRYGIVLGGPQAVAEAVVDAVRRNLS
jgi:hypothetical protein